MVANSRPRSSGERLRSTPWPREHGSWVLLCGPVTLTLLAYGPGDYRMPWLLVSIITLFLAREPLVSLVRQTGQGRTSRLRSFWWRWLVIYSGISLVAGTLLILVWRIWDLLILAIPTFLILLLHLWFVRRHAERSLAAEWLGVAGLSLSATATHAALQDGLHPVGFSLWLLCVLFFSSGLLHVRMRIARSLNKNAGRATAWSVTYHGALVLLLVGLVLKEDLSIWFGLAFLPAVVRAFWPLLFPSTGRLNLRQIGYREVLLSILFVITAGLALRFGCPPFAVC